MTNRKSDWSITADIFAIAIFARLLVVIHAFAEPVWDGYYYDLGARRIAEGQGYSEDLWLEGPGGSQERVWLPWAHYPIGYPGLLAMAYRILGSASGVPPMVNIVTGSLLAAVVYRLARHVFVDSKIRPIVAGLLVALHPGLVLYVGAWMTEPLAAVLALGAILSIVTTRLKWPAKLAVAGILLGLATLVRPNAILMAPCLAVVWMAQSKVLSWPKRILHGVSAGVVVGLVALLTVAPWTYRNCKVMDACTLVSTNAGWNLVIGAAPGATGKFEFLVGHTPDGAPACDEGGQVAQDRCWSGYGIKIIRRDFRRWISLIPAKLHYTLDAEWFPINFLREARPDLVSSVTHIRWGRLLTGVNAFILAFAALAAVGRPRLGVRWHELSSQIILLSLVIASLAWGFDRHNPVVWPLGVLACGLPLIPLPGRPAVNAGMFGVLFVVFTTLVTHALFFGEDRYHLVITPAYLILACGIGRSMTSKLRSSPTGESRSSPTGETRVPAKPVSLDLQST